MLIGRHGQTIDAIQYLANAIASAAATRSASRSIVDAAGYRDRRQATLDALALRMAEQALGDRPAGRARADDRGRAQDRPREAEGRPRGRDGERGHRARIARRRPPSSESLRPLLERWLDGVLATPGLTALRTRRRHGEFCSRTPSAGLELVKRRRADRRRRFRRRHSWDSARGSFPEREVTLVEAERRKTEFLEGWRGELPSLRVVWGRAEEQPIETLGVVAKALAHPPAAAEWCLPLVREGSAAILWVRPSVPTGAGGCWQRRSPASSTPSRRGSSSSARRGRRRQGSRPDRRGEEAPACVTTTCRSLYCPKQTNQGLSLGHGRCGHGWCARG